MTGQLAIKIDIRGMDRAQKLLRTIHKCINDMRPAWAEIGDAMIASTRRRFMSSTAPNGAPWKPTKAGNKPLIRTGALMRSIEVSVQHRQMRIGSPLVYAAIHQFGGWAGRGHASHIPARPYLVDAAGNPDRKDVDAIQRITRNFIIRSIER